MEYFNFAERKAIVPFPIAFFLVCIACDHSIEESTLKRDIFRHSKNCRQRNPGSAEKNVSVFECTFCKYLTGNRRHATTHQVTHCADPQYSLVKYSCSKCTRDFATQKALSSHLRQCGPTTKAPANNPSTANAGTLVLEADHHHHHSPPHPNSEEAVHLEPQAYEQENPQTSGVPDTVDDPSANLSFNSVSSLELEDLPTTFDIYP